MAGIALDAARMAGIEELHPVPVKLEQYELVLNGCEGVERLLLTMLEPIYGDGDRIDILLYRVSARDALMLARSLAIAYSLADGLGCKPLKPRLVLLDREPPRGAEPLVARILGRSSRWIATYRLVRLGLALGDMTAINRPESVNLECSGCSREACRALASLLDALGVLAGVIIDSKCASARSFIDSDVVVDAKCPDAVKIACSVIDDAYLMLADCRRFFDIVFNILEVREECLADLVRFEARTGLDECKAGFAVGFKRIADIVLNRRMW